MSGVGYKPSFPESVGRAFSVLRSSAEANRLAHGYIVSSPRVEWGTQAVASFLQWLFCAGPNRPCGDCRACRHIESHTHPDVIWIEPESKSRVIKIDVVREILNPFISQTSFEGGWKAAVLLNADRLNENAANAFLKTLEEPPARSLLFLVTENVTMLLPTIVSRCQILQLDAGERGGAVSPIEKATLEWLRQRTATSGPVAQSAWFQSILREVAERAEKDEKDRAVDGIDKDVMEARVRSRVLESRLEILKVVYLWERDRLICTAGGQAGTLHFKEEANVIAKQSQGLTLSQALKRLRDVEYAAKLLEGNLGETHVFEAVIPA
ncbi:MAG TPA: DNA polymerase III subunit [Kiritimatiellia bacterium]|nr:DNA polymerase III subunit [Kiritimatiellia bacterium]